MTSSPDTLAPARRPGLLGALGLWGASVLAPGLPRAAAAQAAPAHGRAAGGAAPALFPPNDGPLARAVVADEPGAEAIDGRRVLVMANGRAELGAGLEPVAADEDGRWLAFRTGELGYGLLFRPELKPGMLEDMVMEDERPLPEDIGALIEAAREQWPEMQQTAERVAAALVRALGLMDERPKAPVFRVVEPR